MPLKGQIGLKPEDQELIFKGKILEYDEKKILKVMEYQVTMK